MSHGRENEDDFSFLLVFLFEKPIMCPFSSFVRSSLSFLSFACLLSLLFSSLAAAERERERERGRRRRRRRIQLLLSSLLFASAQPKEGSPAPKKDLLVPLLDLLRHLHLITLILRSICRVLVFASRRLLQLLPPEPLVLLLSLPRGAFWVPFGMGLPCHRRTSRWPIAAAH